MEVKAGYKQSEVGVIPEDWDALALGSLVKLQGGYSFRSENFCDFGIPVIRISDIQDGAVATEEATRHPSIKISSQFLIQDGDFLVAMSGATTGKVGVFRNQVPAYQNQRVGRFVVRDNTRTTREFVGHLVRSHAFGSQLKVLLEQGAQPNISGRQIESLLFPVPPNASEQRAIAEALSDVDGLLGGLDRLIAKKRDLKQAAMQQLLTGQTRLPGFHGEWARKPLRGFVRQFIVPMRDKPSRLDGETPWCRIEDFEGVYLEGSKSNQGVDAETIRTMNLKVYPTGTLLVSCSADLGRCAITACPLVSNQTFIGLEIDGTGASNIFFYYLMTSKAQELNNLSSGTTISYLSREQFEAFKVFAPFDKAEQTAIAEVLTDMDAELEALKQRREKTRGLKQAMMQELLTGKTRLV